MKNPTVDILKLAREKRKSLEAPNAQEVHKEKKKMIQKPAEEKKDIVQQKSIEEEFVFVSNLIT